jgi:hypothetical protein
MLVDTELKTLTIKIDNFNNKLSADSFLHIWKTLGSFDGNAMINDYQYQIHGNDKTWRIHDIGKIALKELPAWMIYMSHNLNHEQLKKLMNISDEDEVYFIIFKTQ